MVEFNMTIERGEERYLLSEVIGISGCRTQAKTLDELIKRTKEGISLCLEF